jgi:hypothetical protein
LKERKKERLVPIATGAHLQKKNQPKERKIDRLVPIATSAHLQKKNQSKERRKTSANCIRCPSSSEEEVVVVICSNTLGSTPASHMQSVKNLMTLE